MATTITAAELFAELAAGTVSEIVDLRSRSEVEDAPIEGSRPARVRNVPIYELYDELDGESARVRDGAVVVCGHGNGSALVADEFAARGRQVRSLEGGTAAWARLMVTVEIPLPGDVRVWQLQRPAKGCLSYLVGLPGGAGIVVDPARMTAPYLELAASYDIRIEHVVDSHVHADHLSGGPALAAHVGAAYHLPPEDAGAVPFANAPLREGDELVLGSTVVRVLTMHLPGHTPGTTALLVAERLLLVGDTVFVSGLGRPDLTGQADTLARELFASVHERLEPLDPDTLIAPAHWSTPAEFGPDGLVLTTIGKVFEATLLNERAVEAFVAEILATLPPAPASYDTIRLVNSGRRECSEDELDVLDLGKNQCAVR